MSTEEKKWTEEELEARLQEELKAILEDRRERRAWRQQLEEKQEWLKEWDEMLKKISKWVDENKRVDELLRKADEWHLRGYLGGIIDRVKFYEEQGFRLGKGGKLLKEFRAWETRKWREWCDISDRPPVVIPEIRKLKYILRCEIESLEESLPPKPWFYEDAIQHSQILYLSSKVAALEDIESARKYQQMINWYIKEWNWYLETKELMLRKTRSKDVSRLIMSFC